MLMTKEPKPSVRTMRGWALRPPRIVSGVRPIRRLGRLPLLPGRRLLGGRFLLAFDRHQHFLLHGRGNSRPTREELKY